MITEPNLPEAAEMPWQVQRYRVGKISAGRMKISVFAPVNPSQPIHDVQMCWTGGRDDVKVKLKAIRAFPRSGLTQVKNKITKSNQYDGDYVAISMEDEEKGDPRKGEESRKQNERAN